VAHGAVVFLWICFVIGACNSVSQGRSFGGVVGGYVWGDHEMSFV